MNALERFAQWFNAERIPVFDGQGFDAVHVEESKPETILNWNGERDGKRYRVTTAKLYEVIKNNPPANAPAQE